MAYTNVWSTATPTGAEAANTIDDIFRGLKLDLQERLDDFLNISSFPADPLRLGGLKFTDSADSIIFLGDNAGTPRSLKIRDKTGVTNYFVFNGGLMQSFVPISNQGATSSSYTTVALGDSANQKIWRFINGAGGPGDGTLSLLAVDDAIATSNPALTITRSGTTILKSDFGSRIASGDITNSVAKGTFSDTNSLNSLDLNVANILGLTSSFTNPNSSSSWASAKISVQQAIATSGTTYGLHMFGGASHTVGTVNNITVAGSVAGANGNGGTTTTLNGFSINCVTGVGAIVTTYNGLLFFAPSGAGTITNVNAINIGNMGTGATQFAIKTGTGQVQLGDQLILAATTGTRAPLRFQTGGTVPAAPNDGEMWYDSVGAAVKFRLGGTTKTFTLV